MSISTDSQNRGKAGHFHANRQRKNIRAGLDMGPQMPERVWPPDSTIRCRSYLVSRRNVCNAGGLLTEQPHLRTSPAILANTPWRIMNGSPAFCFTLPGFRLWQCFLPRGLMIDCAASLLWPSVGEPGQAFRARPTTSRTVSAVYTATTSFGSGVKLTAGVMHETMTGTRRLLPCARGQLAGVVGVACSTYGQPAQTGVLDGT